MKKTYLLFWILILVFGITINTKGQETIVKGKVHKWLSDTVFICELPFHSPYSYSFKYQTLSGDSTFNFQFLDKTQPFVFFISYNKNILKG